MNDDPRTVEHETNDERDRQKQFVVLDQHVVINTVVARVRHRPVRHRHDKQRVHDDVCEEQPSHLSPLVPDQTWVPACM